MDLLFFFCLVFVMPCARLFICVLWSPAGKGLTSWLSFVGVKCEFVTFPLVSWVRCLTLLYRFLIFGFTNLVWLSWPFLRVFALSHYLPLAPDTLHLSLFLSCWFDYHNHLSLQVLFHVTSLFFELALAG